MKKEVNATISLVFTFLFIFLYLQDSQGQNVTSSPIVTPTQLRQPISPFDLDKTTLEKDLAPPEPIPSPKISADQLVGYDVIKIYFRNNQIDYAKKLALKYLDKYPEDGDVRLLLGQIYMREENYAQAKREFYRILEKYPKYIDAWVFLSDIELKGDNTTCALAIVHTGLRQKKDDPFLMIQKAKILFSLRQYAQAAVLAREVKAKNSCNEEAVKQANNILKNVKDVNPRYLHGLNQIGIWSENDHVSDLRTWWDYSGVYYTRDTYLGRIAANVNYANRFGVDARQAAFEFSPILHKYFYMDLIVARANDPLIFPDYVFGAEAYFVPPHFIEMSLGAKYSQIKQTYFTNYTGSLSKTIGNYWFSFRPYFYVPKTGATSTLSTGTIRRYFGTDDYYLGVTIGGGRSPDLADLETVGFITIKNNFVVGNFEFPLFDHRLIVDLSGNFQRWEYPSGLVRKLTGGLLGLKYRF